MNLFQKVLSGLMKSMQERFTKNRQLLKISWYNLERVFNYRIDEICTTIVHKI